MNSINEKQNNQKQLERLAAQRELYSAAKKLVGLQIILAVTIPIGLALVSLFIQELAIVAAIYGVLVFIIDITFIEPYIKSRKTKAAKIQELFDCDVLMLPKSPLKTVDDITVEEVLTHYNAHIKVKTNIDKIKDWYPVIIKELPLNFARIICQRTNCWWDSRLRERYSMFLKISSFSVFSVIIIIGLLAHLTLIEVTLVASGLIPFFQFCIKQHNDNLDAAKRLNELVYFANNLWDKAISGKYSDKYLTIDSRRLQDEIFEHRSNSPLILDFYYKLFRNENEELMNRSSEILVEEVQERKLPPTP